MEKLEETTASTAWYVDELAMLVVGGQEKDTAHAETTPGARARGGGGRDKMRSDIARSARPTADKKPLVSPLTSITNWSYRSYRWL